MSLFAGVTRMGRQIAEAKMESVCVIRRQTGVDRDEGTGVETPTWSVIYSGKCSFKYSDARPDDLDVVGQQVASQRPQLSIPVSAAGSAAVMVNDVAEITGNPLDAGLVGVKVRVAGIHALTHATARRLPVQVLS